MNDRQIMDLVRRANTDSDTLREQVFRLERELAALQQKHAHLQQIYNKLADQWNVFQATNRPDNRNIQRAEGAGEMARKLAEVLLGVAYSTDVRDLLRKLLDDMEGSGGQTVEVSEKLVTTHRVK